MKYNTIYCAFSSQLDAFLLFTYSIGSIHAEMIILVGNGYGDRSSNPCRGSLSRNTNTIVKRYESNYGPTGYGYIIGQTWFFLPCSGNQSRRRKTWNSSLLNST